MISSKGEAIKHSTNNDYTAERYSENYKLATNQTKKSTSANTKLITSITVVLTVLLASISRLISGIKIIENSINISSYSIEYDFDIDYKKSQSLIIKLSNDDYSVEVDVNNEKMIGIFNDLIPNTEYTLEIINKSLLSGSTIYIKQVTTYKENNNE